MIGFGSPDVIIPKVSPNHCSETVPLGSGPEVRRPRKAGGGGFGVGENVGVNKNIKRRISIPFIYELEKYVWRANGHYWAVVCYW